MSENEAAPGENAPPPSSGGLSVGEDHLSVTAGGVDKQLPEAHHALDRVRAKLDSAGCRIHDTGHHRFQVQCPAHDDRNPSLTVTGIEGSVLVHCHAGCDTRDVLAALGLSLRDLYDAPQQRYTYSDGRVVHRTWDQQSGTFRRFWQSGVTTGTALYRADHLDGAVTVYVAEGEKDVHALEALGVTAVCNPGGAGKADRADWTPLQGTNVIIVADNDEAGHKHARDVAHQLDGLAASVLTVEAKVGKDTADHVAAGCGVDDFQHIEDVVHAGTAWQPPLPLDEPAPPEFPVECLGDLAPLVRTVADNMQVSADLPAMSALGVISAALGARRSVEVDPSWTESGVLYIVIAMGSGERKTAVLKVMDTPLRMAEKHMIENTKSDRSQRKQRYEILVKRKDAGEKECAKEGDNGPGEHKAREAREELDKMGGPPVAPRMLAGDCTPEALAGLLAQHEERIAIISGEGGVVASLTGRYSEGANMDLLLSSYVGEPWSSDRVSREEAQRLDSPHLTLLTCTQPEVLDKLAGQHEQEAEHRGLTARVHWSVPQATVGRRSTRPPPLDQNVIAEWTTTVQELVDTVYQQPKKTIPMSPEARDVLQRFWDAHEPRMHEETGDLADIVRWASKEIGGLTRIALMLQMAHDPAAREISARHMRDAVGLAGYFEAHARRALARTESRRAKELKPARQILAKIRAKQWQHFTVADMYQAVRQQTWVDSSDSVRAACRDLVTTEWIAADPTETSTRGRQTGDCYVVSPYTWRRPNPVPDIPDNSTGADIKDIQNTNRSPSSDETEANAVSGATPDEPANPGCDHCGATPSQIHHNTGRRLCRDHHPHQQEEQ